MIRRAPLFTLATFACVLSAGIAQADTGTYEILDYRVKLTPHTDGVVEIEYYQKWLVTGGGIPWITVGTSSGDFDIIGNRTKGAVRSIRKESGAGWSDVRIDLDCNYSSGETFEVTFAVIQRGLFYADADNYRLKFTPGWYDRAPTRNLRLEVFFFAPIETVAADPPPTRREGQGLIWDGRRLRPGEKFAISVAFPRKLFPRGIETASERPAESPARYTESCQTVVLVLVIVALIVMRIAWGFVRGRIYGGGGSIFHGGGGTGGASSGGIFSGGGGGFGGRAASCVCACACVGCACACACAGGGAAGCDRKTRHTCPLCKTCPAAGCLLRREVAP